MGGAKCLPWPSSVFLRFGRALGRDTSVVCLYKKRFHTRALVIHTLCVHLERKMLLPPDETVT